MNVPYLVTYPYNAHAPCANTSSLTVRGAQSSRASLVFPSLPFSTRKPAFHDDAIASE